MGLGIPPGEFWDRNSYSGNCHKHIYLVFIYWVSTLCQIPHALYSIILFNLYHNTEINKGTERSCTLPKITQLVNWKPRQSD